MQTALKQSDTYLSATKADLTKRSKSIPQKCAKKVLEASEISGPKKNIRNEHIGTESNYVTGIG